MQRGVQFQTEIPKFSRRSPRSVDDVVVLRAEDDKEMYKDL